MVPSGTLPAPTPPHARDDAALRAFTRRGGEPSPTLALVLFALVVAVVAMEVDAVARYSEAAFLAGVGATLALALVVGAVLGRARGRARTAVAVLLPTALGALVGMLVQGLVLADVRGAVVRDLGGLVDTTTPLAWIAGGVLLGGVPALAVAAFLLLAGRALRRGRGHDAAEGFGVAFTGAAGLAAAIALPFTRPLAAAPLFAVAAVAGLSLVVCLLVDGARLRLLRRVYAGRDGGLEIAPRERFADDPSLAPVVGRAGVGAVLVRVDRVGSYRASAGEPVALLGASEEETLRPLLHRRQTAASLLLAFVALSTVAGYLSFVG